MQLDTNSLWYGDNIAILEVFPSNSVDLIYLDPPYNSKRDYNCTFGAEAQSRAFKDTWTWNKDADQAMTRLAETAPNVNTLLQSLGMLLPKHGLLPYLVNMAARLVEMHRVLKPTGSIYLHVDPTASHYLKLVIDQVFGGQNFRNEVIWCYTRMANSKQRHLSRLHDTIFWYTKSGEYTFEPNRIREEYAASSKARAGYKKTNLGGGSPESGICELNEGGKFPQDWIEIPLLRGNERLGYDTQKPIALLERIILASSNEGDVVLDPYMGSGTTIEAAAKHGRQWIGIDITHHAVACVRNRLEACGITLEPDQIHGIPRDIASAKHLKQNDPRQFDAWCATECIASPQDDGDRIVGLRKFDFFKDREPCVGKALYMATNDDPPTIEDIRAAVCKMKQYKCDKAFLFCFEKPQDLATLRFLEDQGAFRDDFRETPVVELITIRELLNGNGQKIYHDYRQRRLRDLSNQLELV
jgi:site-specific DNA-methyltransferase (adenine-specific)